MKKIFVLLFIAVAIQGFSQNFTNQNYIQVTGESEIEIVPDEIYLQIIINEQDNKGKESVESLENKMVKKLKELKINIDEDLSIRDLSSNFQKYFLKQTDIFTSKEYQLILHDAKTLGKVFVALEEIGISNISITKVDHSKIKEFENNARSEAIREAKAKAFGLTASIQQEIGKAIYIHEFEIYNNRQMVSAVAYSRKMEVDDSPAPIIEFEKIKVESKVEVFFELK